MSDYPLPEGATGWCYVPDGTVLWHARPRWDGFGYEVRQLVTPSSVYVGSRMLTTTLEGARALLPRGWVVEECDGHTGRGNDLYAYRSAQ